MAVGGRGGHLSFAPVMPQDGEKVLAYAKRVKAIYQQMGQDYYSTFTIGRRHINNVSLILYDRDDPAGRRSSRGIAFAGMQEAR